MMLIADKQYKPFDPSSAQTKCQGLSDSKLFDIMMVSLKELFVNVIFFL